MKEMLKSIIGLLFIVLVISPYVTKTVVLIDFYVHQKEISSELCVERFAEESCCQGQCVLQKELQKSEGSTDHWPQVLKEKIETVYDVQTDAVSAHYSFKEDLKHQAFYQPLRSEISLPCLVHPPCC